MPNDRRGTAIAVAITLLVIGLGTYPQWRDKIGPIEYLLPGADQAYAREADEALKAKNWKEAIEFANKSLEKNSNNRLARWTLAQASMYTNQDAKAIEECDWLMKNKQVVESKDSTDVLLLRAAANAKLRRYLAAAEDYGAAYKLETKPAYLLAQVGCLSETGEYAQALWVLEEVADVRPLTKDLQAAEQKLIMQCFHQAIGDHRRRKRDFDPYLDAAYAMVRNKAYNDALQATNRAISLGAGKAPLAYRLRGDAYFGLGKYPEAVADYDRSLKILPNDDLTKRHRDRAQEKMRLN
jgi:tetratricopeptide (TPR) repeat protein